MSKEGLPDITHVDATGLTIGIVTSTWNEEICQRLHSEAIAAAQRCHAQVIERRVIGALELPIVAQRLAKLCDAVVASGCVIRGGTPHFDYVCDSVTQGLTRIALDEQTPIGNGVLTTENEDQARDRAGFEDSVENKGAEATVAALHTAVVLRSLDGV